MHRGVWSRDDSCMLGRWVRAGKKVRCITEGDIRSGEALFSPGSFRQRRTNIKEGHESPGQCYSVFRALAHIPKTGRFDSHVACPCVASLPLV